METSMASDSTVHWTVEFDHKEVAAMLKAHGAAEKAGATQAEADPRAAAPRDREEILGFRIPANLDGRARGAGALPWAS